MAISETAPGPGKSAVSSVKPALFEKARGFRFGIVGQMVLSTAVVGAIVIAALSISMYRGGADILLQNEVGKLAGATDVSAARLNARFSFYRADALFLSKTPPIQGIVRSAQNSGVDPVDGSTESLWVGRLATIFTAMITSRPEFYQVRFLDDHGQETVRVDRKSDGSIVQTPPDALQDKSTHAYFVDSIALSEGQVYISTINLNREFGEIEVPHRPVVRFATPAFSDNGDRLGVIVINVDIQYLFDQVTPRGGGRIIDMIANDQGDYLDTPDKGRAFGFDLGHRYLIQEEIPPFAPLFDMGGPDQYEGVVDYDSHRYVASARRVPFDPENPQRFLVVTQMSPEGVMSGALAELRNNAVFLALGLLVVSAIVIAWLAHRIARPLHEVTAAASTLAAGGKDIDLSNAIQRNDETGELARAFTRMATNVTEREEELMRSNQELAQFAYVASHDLQEPLRMVGSYLELLSRRYRGKLDAEADEFIGFAVDGATRMKQLINDLLGYSRVSNRPLKVEPVDMNDIMAAVEDSLGPLIEETGASIVVDSLPTVVADPVQAERLFTNLIQNAIKYRGEATPEVRVSATRRDRFWEFSVTDNGIGIDPQFREKVFEIFTRLHSREKYQGTGIGLAACKKIIDRHGGLIWIDTAPDGGCVFRFTLPVDQKVGDRK